MGNSLSYVPMEAYNIYPNRYNYGRAVLSFDLANFHRTGLEHRLVLFKDYQEAANFGSIWGFRQFGN
jgi:hypothetical protein